VTTRTILTDLRAYIDDLIQGYAVKYFRWTDADESSESPFVMMRFPGSGNSDPLLQRIDVLLTLVQQPAGAVSGHDTMAAIVRRIREGGGYGDVLRFEVLSEPAGPMYLENGRPVWVADIRCYTEGN
jgi:hypothetical protein